MICNKCGKENINTNKNCIYCGNQLIFEQINFNYQTTPTKSKKWIFIAVACVIAIPIFIMGVIFSIALVVTLIENANDPFDGKWFCSTYANSNDYSLALDFNNDDYRFTIYKYKDEANNYLTGEYDYDKVKDKNEYHYELELDVEKYILGGKLQDNISEDYIVEFTDEDKSQMILTDEKSSSTYYCIKR